MKKIIKQYAHDFRGIALSQYQLEDIFTKCLIECLEKEEVKHTADTNEYNYLLSLKREILQ